MTFVQPEDVVWYVEAKPPGAGLVEGSAVAIRLQRIISNDDGTTRGDPNTAKTYLLTCAHVLRGRSSDGMEGFGKLVPEGSIRVWMPGTGLGDSQAKLARISSEVRRVETGEIPKSRRTNPVDDWVVLEIMDEYAARAAKALYAADFAQDPPGSGDYRLVAYPGGAESLQRGVVSPTTTRPSRFRDEHLGLLRLTGAESAPGMSGGGVFHETPTANPDKPRFQFSGLHRARQYDTLQLHAVSVQAVLTHLNSDQVPFELCREKAAGSIPKPMPTQVAEEHEFTPPECLASFTELDQAFYPKLLPGPERDGLPESIGIWKRGIDQRTKSFRVGVIRGPSGCGKSSLVKAGILPRLADHVERVFIEADPERTERRLRSEVQERMALAHDSLDLAVVFRQARDKAASNKKKLLVVIDQCEQWLQRYPQPATTELGRALRVCDGVALQALLLVREDYSVSLMRLVREFDQELDAADVVERVCFLFEPEHAERVLAIFGNGHNRSGYERVAEFDDWPLNDQRRKFLRAAVELLQGTDSTVVSLHIALFAWMMRSKDWQTSELDASFQQLGLKYLQQSLDPPHGNTTLRGHITGVRRFLRQLLPPEGEMRKVLETAETLQQALGNNSAFPDVIRELDMGVNDSGLRLITPTQPDDTLAVHSPAIWYRLTHDFLVQSLRAWLAEGLQKTWHGRMVLQAQRLSKSWANSTDDKARFLPGVLAWPLMQLASWRHPQEWRDHLWEVPAEYWRAARNHFLRWNTGFTALALLVTVLPLVLYWNARAELRVDHLVKDLESPLMSDGLIARNWDLYRNDHERLERRLNQLPTASTEMTETDQQAEAKRTAENFELARLAFDSAGAVTLVDRLLTQTDPYEFNELFKRIAEYDDSPNQIVIKLEAIVQEGHQAIEFHRPDFERQLVELGTRRAKAAIALIRLKQPDKAAAIFDPVPLKLTRRTLATWNKEDQEILRQRDLFGDPDELHAAIEREKDVLQDTLDPEGQTQFIQKFQKFGVQPEDIRNLYDKFFATTDKQPQATPAAKHAILICLAKCISADEKEKDKDNLRDAAKRLYRHDPSAAVHGAARWLLTEGFGLTAENMRAIDTELARVAARPAAEWLVRNDRDYCRTFIRFPETPAFPLGSPRLTTRFLKEFNRNLCDGTIERPLYICQQEVTREEFEAYLNAIENSGAMLEKKLSYKLNKSNTWVYPGPINPIGNVRWYHAIGFCQWLSKDPDKYCYKPQPEGFDEQINLDEDVLAWKTVPNHLDKRGFRLPTELEWEYACRAGTGTSFSFGSDYALTTQYAWFLENREQNLISLPGCTRLPNLLGLFDMHGNMMEWCQEPGWVFGKVGDAKVRDEKRRLVRGGGWQDPSHMNRTAWIHKYFPYTSHGGIGFRIVYTDTSTPPSSAPNR